MRKICTLFCTLFILSGCKEEDKILNELKEMNHRQDHYYRTQLYLRKLDDEINSVFSVKEKQEILEYRKNQENELKPDSHVLIIEDLRKLKELNKKNFTGTFSVGVRSYVLSKSSSWISEIPKLLLRTFTSNKYDKDIYAFNGFADNICFMKIRKWQQDWFPDYVSLEHEKTQEYCKYDVQLTMKYIDEKIQREIDSHLKSVEIIERYSKK